ncbi:MAG: ribosome small subunit-dependent GTPase A [Oscillospiraceae bacterium]|nr:ribosome small subunit-dependent GTPase A [Oscillospiraceae bacterium]
MTEGIIIKALSGFYYVETANGIVSCKARGKFRLDGTSPLVGDRVRLSPEKDGSGRIEEVLQRKNFFIRPAVANIDALVFIAANVNPVTDPFLIDRVAVIAHEANCELIVCVNKIDLDTGDDLYDIYRNAGYHVIRTSAETGEGAAELSEAMRGKVCAFTGNSGVGKSSILNVLLPEAAIPTDAVSEHLGRGKHTTRHVELYPLGDDTFVADTPGFASFEISMMQAISKERLQYDFPEFEPFIGKCRFLDCAHIREPDCAVRCALAEGKIGPTRYASYVRLYELTARQKPWEIKSN